MMIILMTILGFLAGIGATLAVYPCILQYRAKKLIALCSKDIEQAGDPVSNYLALLLYQLTQAYEYLDEKDIADAVAEIESIIAGYCSFLEMKCGRSISEQDTFDAIMQACNRSETLQRAVDERKSVSNRQPVNQIIKELEKELAEQ